MKRLTDVNIKTTAQVEGLLSEGNLRERMLALGFTQGALNRCFEKRVLKII